MSTNTYNGLVPSKKPQRISYAETHCISDLPDWAISHILSRLHTKTAVRTSVLSKDWEYKWTSVDNLEFDDRIGNKSNKKPFANFVERTLFLAHSIQSLRLSCSKKYDLHRMKTWISFALNRNVHFLRIFYLESGIVLPRNLLNCSVKDLELNLPCTFKVPAEICFLHLTTLCLSRVDISNELSNSCLVKFKFPVLEKFKLYNCKWLNVKFIEFYAPKMTSFESKPRDDDPGDYSIKIMGDSLVRFNSHGILPGNIILSGPAVAYASLETSYTSYSFGYGYNHESRDFHLLEKSGSQFRKLLEGFPSLKELKLSGLVAKAIFLSKQGLPLPKYYNMQRLVLSSLGDAWTLLELLHAAPSLKFLTMHSRGWNDYDYDKVDIPSSVVFELEEVKFVGFDGEMDEFKLAKFLIKNASELQRFCVNVYHNPRISKNRISEELSRYPKASACLTINVK